MVALGGMIEYDVENDLDACPMQRFDHIAKFVQRAECILPRAIGLVRRKEGNWRIAPVIDSSRRAILGVELKDGQQFHGGDAEFLQIGNLFDQTGIGSSLIGGHARARMAGEPSHMHFIDDRAGRGTLSGTSPSHS